MNLTEFLNQVNQRTQTMGQKQLSASILDIARTYPELRRIEFLKLLETSTQDRNQESASLNQEQVEALAKQYKKLKVAIKKIDSGESTVDGDLNNFYDEWGNDDEEEFIFQDPMGIGAILDEAGDFIHKCVDVGWIAEGYELVKKMVRLEIVIEGEYREYSYDEECYLCMSDMVEMGLTQVNYRKMVIEGMYLAYRANQLEKRSEALYRLANESKVDELCIEEVMQAGEELQDINEFLPRWADYLCSLKEKLAWELLVEVIGLMDDSAQALEFTRKNYDQHPGLYEAYLKNYINHMSQEDIDLIADEALDRLPIAYLTRGRLANFLLSIESKREMNREQELERQEHLNRYRIEAFRSDTCLSNYLNILTTCQEYAQHRKELQNINHTTFKLQNDPSKANEQYSHLSYDLQLNEVMPNHHYMIALLEGEYDYVKNHAMKAQGGLGWSGSFMKVGLAAYLLLLNASDTLGDGGKAMVKKVMDLLAGSNNHIYDSSGNKILYIINSIDTELLWDCFQISRLNNVAASKDQEMTISWVEALISTRVAAIMEGNHRRFYDECAAYIAALGEVLEAGGADNAKELIMQNYRSKYSKRSAFHTELRAYGMKEHRKGRK